jgi:hypothetical protein
LLCDTVAEGRRTPGIPISLYVPPRNHKQSGV